MAEDGREASIATFADLASIAALVVGLLLLGLQGWIQAGLVLSITFAAFRLVRVRRHTDTWGAAVQGLVPDIGAVISLACALGFAAVLVIDIASSEESSESATPPTNAPTPTIAPTTSGPLSGDRIITDVAANPEARVAVWNQIVDALGRTIYLDITFDYEQFDKYFDVDLPPELRGPEPFNGQPDRWSDGFSRDDGGELVIGRDCPESGAFEVPDLACDRMIINVSKPASAENPVPMYHEHGVIRLVGLFDVVEVSRYHMASRTVYLRPVDRFPRP